MKVLIAEDDRIYRTLLQKQVKMWGFEPQCFDDGAPAWDSLCEDNSPARIVILDWQMTEMDGIELCQKLKQDKDRPYTYVIILTSRSSKEDMLQGLDSGADDFLSKPVDPALLESRLKIAKRIVEAVQPKESRKPVIPGYELLELLGEGAFASVWRARRESTTQDVALKLLSVDLVTKNVLHRFSREVRILQRVNHPNVARMFDSQIDPDCAYYAMELMERGTLTQYTQQEKLRGIEVIKIMCKVLDGLHHLHSHGIIHRDLKPGNIMMTDEKEPKIVDFGLGKSIMPSKVVDPQLTLEKMVLGTPLFMSPEQARGEHDIVDERSDVYAAAVVLYVLLLKRHPIDVGSMELHELLEDISIGEIVEPRQVHPQFNTDLEKIILKGLAKDREQRYRTAGEFSEDIVRWLAERRERAKKNRESV